MIKKLFNIFKPLEDKETITDKNKINKMYRVWRIKMFLGVYVGYLVYYLNRKNISYAAPSLISELGITKIQFGILGSTMAVTYGIGKFLSGIISDKCSIRTFMAIGLIGSSIINLFWGSLTSLPLLVFFWGINGGLQSMGYPPALRTIVYWFPRSEKTMKYTIWSSSHRLGTALLGILAGIFIAIGHWRAIFYAPGIIGIITGITLLFVLTDKPSSIGLPSVDVYHNDIQQKETNKNYSELSYFQILKKHIFINKNMWMVSISGIFLFIALSFILDWSTLFMVSVGISKSKAAFLLALAPFVGCFGGIFGGFIVDKCFKGRAAPVMIIFLILLVFSIFGLYKVATSSYPLWVVGLFLSFVGFFSDGPPMFGTMVVSNLIPKKYIGAGCGFLGLFHYIGNFVSGIFIALIVENFGWYKTFITVCVFCILAIIFLIPILNKEKILLK
jgi:sugar phosphate permease